VKSLSSAAEDCLLFAYRLSERGEELSISALARGLGVGDSTITAMIQKLAKLKLVNHVPRREISLSKTGGGAGAESDATAPAD
jgi:Mn-dependent DtxR family transcriptional regulator